MNSLLLDLIVNSPLQQLMSDLAPSNLIAMGQDNPMIGLLISTLFGVTLVGSLFIIFCRTVLD